MTKKKGDVWDASKFKAYVRLSGSLPYARGSKYMFALLAEAACNDPEISDKEAMAMQREAIGMLDNEKLWKTA